MLKHKNKSILANAFSVS